MIPICELKSNLLLAQFKILLKLIHQFAIFYLNYHFVCFSLFSNHGNCRFGFVFVFVFKNKANSTRSLCQKFPSKIVYIDRIHSPFENTPKIYLLVNFDSFPQLDLNIYQSDAFLYIQLHCWELFEYFKWKESKQLFKVLEYFNLTINIIFL